MAVIATPDRSARKEMPARHPEKMPDDYQWRDLIKSARVMTLPARTLAIRAGDPCNNFLLIEKGTIRVSQRSQDGRSLTLHRANAGEVCVYTLQALIESRDYDVDLYSEDQAQVLSVPQQEFYRCMAESEAFRRFIVSLLSRRLCDMTRLVQQVAFQGLDLRLACQLGQLFERRGDARLEVTHLELANELGCTREVVSRLLKEFEQKGCVRLYRGSIELLSSDTLEQLTASGLN